MLNKNIILHLTLIEDIGPAIICKIMERSDVQSSDLYFFSIADWMHVFGLSEKTASKIVAGLSDQKMLEQELYLIEKNNIQWITIADESYPALLKEIHLPPTVLYFQGTGFEENPSILFEDKKLRANGAGEMILNKRNIAEENLDATSDIFSLNNLESPSSVRPECAEGVYRRVFPKCLAIVGSRKATAYGQQVISSIVPDLVAAGYTIVSGGALGIDTMAHEAALACGGKTIAVLGSGLLNLYPHQNKFLFKKIIENDGAIISSYPLAMEPLPGNFPARNRIVTGLSRGCLVVQAAQKSGALISAHCALEQGRDVFAVPGLFDDELSAGCHEIIKQGAKLTVSAADILSEFGDRIVMPALRSLGEGRVEGRMGTPMKSSAELGKDERSKYSETQKNILRVCAKPISCDDIIVVTQLSSEIVQAELFNLQLEGIIEQDFMGMWIINDSNILMQSN